MPRRIGVRLDVLPPSFDYLGCALFYLAHTALMILCAAVILLVPCLIRPIPFISFVDVFIMGLTGPFVQYHIGTSGFPSPLCCASSVLVPFWIFLYASARIEDIQWRRIAIVGTDLVFAAIWAFMAAVVIGLALT